MTNDMTGTALASIGPNHGYRFAGDQVDINAELNFADPAAASWRQWALQLWASPSGFADGQPAGVKVAEVPVFPEWGWQPVAATVAALPPAGASEQHMALALVSWGPDGFPEVAHLVPYAASAAFCQPCIAGNVSLELGDGTADLGLDGIVNPRAEDNVSGTLALEVWALPEPYAGGSWAGVPVASLVVGVLEGGRSWNANRFAVPAALPAPGAHLAVMLREWTPAGFVTRDYRNLGEWPVPAPAAEPQPEMAAPAAAEAVFATPEAAVQTVRKTVAPTRAKAGASGRKPRKGAKPVLTKPVAVNTAKGERMRAVKWLSAAVARAIIAGRPYASLDDLCRVRGMGPKLLAKIRHQLTL